MIPPLRSGSPKVRSRAARTPCTRPTTVMIRMPWTARRPTPTSSLGIPLRPNSRPFARPRPPRTCPDTRHRARWRMGRCNAGDQGGSGLTGRLFSATSIASIPTVAATQALRQARPTQRIKPGPMPGRQQRRRHQPPWLGRRARSTKSACRLHHLRTGSATVITYQMMTCREMAQRTMA